jgi:N-acetyl-1-D-myo-inositol-2-amino-2-deoxy-alpha-D-glucopyranoside deacetylase
VSTAVPPGAPSDEPGGPTGGLLAVHAHPDDETLATGALLATWAAAGLPVTVVTATRGERGEVIPPALAHLEGDGPALAAHRAGELAAALTALGVADHAFLDELGGGRTYEDSGMVWVGTARAGVGADVPAGGFVAVPLDEAAGRLAGLLRARRPRLVVTYDPEGGYGHPDHVRVHEVTMRAVELAAGDGWEPAVWWRRTGRTALAAGYRALRGDAVRATLGAAYDELTPPEPPFPAVAMDDDAVELLVDVAPVRDRILAALRAHATQVQAVRAVPGEPALLGCYALSDGVLQPLLPAEGYVQVRGPRLPGSAPTRRLP